MSKPSLTGASDLTGEWHGLYTYENGQSVAFVATLHQVGSSLSGATGETCVHLGRTCTLQATLSGSRSGSMVFFTKSYDRPPDRAFRNPVQYTGDLNGDSTEIEGVWKIGGSLFRASASGKFLMVRTTGEAESVSESKPEPVKASGHR